MKFRRSLTVSCVCLILFHQFFANSAGVIRSALFTLASEDVKGYIGLRKTVIALDPHFCVTVLVWHNVFIEFLVKVCLKLGWVAYGLPTERASNVILDIVVIAGSVQRMPTWKEHYAQS